MAPLFTIPLWLDLTAVAVGAIQGAMFASRFRENRLDLLGVAIIGLVIGLGGGLARDILINQVPASMQNNWYLITAIGAALMGMLLLRLFDRLNPLIIALDALTIGLFAAIGTAKALSVGLPEVPAIFIGVVAAVGGSVVRDIMLNLPVALMHVGSLYAAAAAAGTIAMATAVRLEVPVVTAAIGCVILTTVVRLLSVRYGWSLPEQRALSSWPRWRRRQSGIINGGDRGGPRRWVPRRRLRDD
ncbi:trimeric intracellular cation channel family protein [Mycetocola spongiae]|uniref:trimeric intracellular cation channel family protein n=1 Tax=Mycetocola spongiae TaxID=2859226 RepID=UPI001CF1DC5A|nr:TRIC cation channel family protein [Mycetocola spongiae]UCR89448.1 TRIC cation channel family protein [Mycetocola spongiae]